MTKRQYTAEFKTKIVLEILQGEQELGAIASKYQINPNQLRTWKALFLEKAPIVFETDRPGKEAAAREREASEEKATMLKTIGQLTMERDFLQQQVQGKIKGVQFRRR